MFGRYAIPTDEIAQDMDTITASAEDPHYEALNAVIHVNRRPAKLTTNSGYWDLQFPAPVTVGVVALIHANFDEDLDVTIEPDGGTPVPVVCPGPNLNGWWPSPWVEFAPQTSDLWRVSINGSNTDLPQILKILFYLQLRDLENDVRWGVVEDEEQGDVYHVTDGGSENVAEVWGPRRAFSGEFALRDVKADELIRLHRSVKQRILPWLLIPDVAVNDAWWVRFQGTRWSRGRDNPDHNLHEYLVREIGRGLPFP